VKTCLRAAYRDGEVGGLLDLSLVGDDHEFGLQPDGTIHIAGHGEYTITRGRMREGGPLKPPAVDGVPFSNVIAGEDGHLSSTVN
jgi:hypothetical protein